MGFWSQDQRCFPKTIKSSSRELNCFQQGRELHSRLLCLYKWSNSWQLHRHWACCWPFLNKPLSAWEGMVRGASPGWGAQANPSPTSATTWPAHSLAGWGSMGESSPSSALTPHTTPSLSAPFLNSLIEIFPMVCSPSHLFCAKQVALNKLHLLKHFWGAFFPLVI